MMTARRIQDVIDLLTAVLQDLPKDSDTIPGLLEMRQELEKQLVQESETRQEIVHGMTLAAFLVDGLRGARSSLEAFECMLRTGIGSGDLRTKETKERTAGYRAAAHVLSRLQEPLTEILEEAGED